MSGVRTFGLKGKIGIFITEVTRKSLFTMYNFPDIFWLLPIILGVFVFQQLFN